MKLFIQTILVASMTMVSFFNAHAVTIGEDGRGCTDPIIDTFPMPLPQDLCDIFPQLCDDDEKGPLMDLAQGLADGATAAAMVEQGNISAGEGATFAIQSARTTMNALKVNRTVQTQTMRLYRRTANRGMRSVERGRVGFEVIADRLANILLDGISEGSEEGQALADKTVTTTIKGWFEFDFGFFKWGSSTEVTETETVSTGGSTSSDDDTGECAEDGVCVCPVE